jgi:hypothetical protein
MAAILASLTIPVRTAREHFGNAPKGLLMDHRQVVKAALASAFGEGALRPWRLDGNDGRFYTVTGWVNPELTRPEFDDGCRGLGAAVHLDTYHAPKAGSLLDLQLHASPQRDVRRREQGTGVRRSSMLDVAGLVEGPATKAYADWIRKHVEVPRSGVEIVGDIEILTSAATQGIYRNGDRLVPSRIPRVEAIVPVRVVEPGAYMNFLRRGVGPLLHVGYGSLIPGGLVDGQ